MVSVVKEATAPSSPAPQPGTEPERRPQTGGNLGEQVRYPFGPLGTRPERSVAEFSPPSTLGLSRLAPNPGIGVPPTEVMTPSTVTGIDLGFGGRKGVKSDG
jgi:hypothetical protein